MGLPDHNTAEGRITATAMCVARNYGYYYTGRQGAYHYFEKNSSHGPFIIKCTDDDVKGYLLPIMLREFFTR